jgi:D-alanyl-D-alanine carboxypeptidase
MLLNAIILLVLNFTYLGQEANAIQPRNYYPVSKEYIDFDSTAKQLNKIIEGILAKNQSILSNTKYSLGVVELNEMNYLYGKNITLPLTPASTTKLFTTFNAMVKYANDPYIKTSLYHDGSINNGVLKGNIYLYGRGDVMLTGEDLKVIVKQIHEKGIRRIDGNLVVDDSFFDKNYKRSNYSGDFEEVQSLPLIKPYVINKNTLTITCSADEEIGESVNVTINPNSALFIAKNNAITKNAVHKRVRSIAKGKGRSSRNRNLGDEVVSLKGNNIRVSANNDSDGRQYFNISGSLAPGRKHLSYYSIKSPELATAGVIVADMKQFGIILNGYVVFGMKPKTSYSLLAEFKRPIIEIAKVVNKYSDNYFAEQLFKFSGANCGYTYNNAEGSKLINKQLCDSLKIPFENCKLHDGSGLSRRNYLTTASEIRLLQLANNNPQLKFDSTLSIAGYDGTLRNRMIGTKAHLNLKAKTGTLRNVSALAGYVNTADNHKLAFSLIFNGPNVGSYKQIENQIGTALANFSFVPKK